MKAGLCFLFCCLFIWTQKAYSQPIYETPQLVHKQFNEVQNSGDNKEKTAALLKRSQWYYDHKTADTTYIAKAFYLAGKARHLAEALHYEQGLLEAYLLLSKIEIVKGNVQQSISAAETALRCAHALADETGKGEAHMALWESNAGNGMSYKEQLPILQKAAVAFHNSGNKKREADCYYRLADTYLYLDDNPNAERKLRAALQLYHEAGYVRLAPVYDLLDVLYMHLDNFGLAVKYGLLAVKTAEDQADTTTGLYYYNLGLTYKTIPDLPLSERYLRKALAVETKLKNLDGIFQISIHLSWVLGCQKKQREGIKLLTDMAHKYPSIEQTDRVQYAGAMLDLHEGLHEYKEAKSFAAILEAAQKTSADNFGAMDVIYNKLIFYYASLGYTQKVKQYLPKYYEHIKVLNTPAAWLEYYLTAAYADSVAGNYYSALSHTKTAKKWSDSMMEKSKMRQISELNIMYATAQKDKNLQTLKEESRFKSLLIRQSHLVRNISIILAASLMAIAITIYIGYRRKQRTNILLKQQQDEIAHKNEALQTLVKEKEWLVKEIHHRVKNNLHMVVGLLASQTEFLKNKEALSAIADSQNRIQAMSLIHQKLYQMGDMSSINMPVYIQELTEHLKDAFRESTHVLFKLAIAAIDFPLTYSVPIGLILNEAITNAMKYAFPDKKGVIEIKLEIQDNFYHLSIKDNGVGLPEDFDPAKSNSLGIILMQGLSGDIGGTFQMKNEEQGLLLETIFPLGNKIR